MAGIHLANCHATAVYDSFRKGSSVPAADVSGQTTRNVMPTRTRKSRLRDAAAIERLLSAYKMDALVSLYYYAPVCTAMNLAASLYFEAPTFSWENVLDVGYFNMIANAGIAFLLNVSLVLLVCLQ